MTKALILCAAITLAASTAFAVGIDLTAGACGNNPGSTFDAGAIDCAGGGGVTLLAVFQPAEAYDDSANGYVLTGIEGILDMNVAGVLSPSGSAAFWDWDQVDGCNPAAFSVNRKAPTFPSSTCRGYTDTFNVPNSGEHAAASRFSPNLQKIMFGCFRPDDNPLSTTANQKLFGAQFYIDGATSAESGMGTCVGCPLPAAIVWSSCTPVVLNSVPTTVLTGPSLYGNCVGINGGAFLCPHGHPVPARAHTWGQLKSLYR